MNAPKSYPLRDQLYAEGLSDRSIAKHAGVREQAIFAWRKVRGLPANLGNGARGYSLTAEADAARMLLYQMRYSDRRIAREQKVAWTTIQGWRKRRKLPPHGLARINWKKSDLTRDTTLDRVRRAIARTLPADIRDDAISDLYLAVLSGTVDLDEVEKQARKFGNRVLNAFASKFGPRSLDQELGDADGFTLMDTLVDERSSVWLEEMGATVW
jgi:hypothetical protein